MTLVSGPATPIMTIGKLSRRTGLSVKGLRRLEGMGLVCTAGRSPAGHRLFDETAIGCVQTIRQLRAIGFTATEMRDLFADYVAEPDRPHLAERLQAVRTRVDASIAELQALRDRIDAFEAQNSAALRGGADAGLFADHSRGDERHARNRGQSP